MISKRLLSEKKNSNDTTTPPSPKKWLISYPFFCHALRYFIFCLTGLPFRERAATPQLAIGPYVTFLPLFVVIVRNEMRRNLKSHKGQNVWCQPQPDLASFRFIFDLPILLFPKMPFKDFWPSQRRGLSTWKKRQSLPGIQSEKNMLPFFFAEA